jgi:hypothetical protein
VVWLMRRFPGRDLPQRGTPLAIDD